MHIPYKLQLLKNIIFRKSEGEIILKNIYKKNFNIDLETESPITFSAKLFTRMILINRYGNPRFTQLADKSMVRDYVKEKIGEKYLVPLIWQGDKTSDIPFENLPSTSVIKTNHGSGGNIIARTPFDRKIITAKLNEWLNENFYWTAREYHYYKIPRKILIEEFLEDQQPDGPLDYRFWCFHGVPEVIQVDNHKHDINPFYNTKWEPINLYYRENFKETKIQKPINYEEMLEVAKALSSDFDFVRVDLYNVKGGIYFGELTFTPAAGNFIFKPETWDKYLGDKWVFKDSNQI